MIIKDGQLPNMNSLPTVSQLKDTEFEQQWDILKTTFKETNINMEVVILITQAVLQIMNTGGYGSVTISMLNNFIQEIKIIQTKRSQAYLVRGEVPPVDNDDSL